MLAHWGRDRRQAAKVSLAQCFIGPASVLLEEIYRNPIAAPGHGQCDPSLIVFVFHWPGEMFRTGTWIPKPANGLSGIAFFLSISRLSAQTCNMWTGNYYAEFGQSRKNANTNYRYVLNYLGLKLREWSQHEVQNRTKTSLSYIFISWTYI